MQRVTGYLELAAMNSDLAAAYMNDVAEDFGAIADKLDDCLRSFRALRKRTAIPGCDDKGLCDFSDFA